MYFQRAIIAAVTAAMFAASIGLSEDTVRTQPASSGPSTSIGKTSGGEAVTGQPESTRPQINVAPAWSLSYVPLVVTEGESVMLIAHREIGAAPPDFRISMLAKDPQPVTDFSTTDKNKDEVLVSFTPASPGIFMISGSGFAAGLKLTSTLKELSGAKAHFNHLTDDSGMLRVLYHSRRVIKDSRKWAVVRAMVKTALPDNLPSETLVIIPGEEKQYDDLIKTLKISGLPGLNITTINDKGLSPFLAFLTHLADKAGGIKNSAKSIVLLLPPGEWNGGLPPDDYRRAVEWLLDRLIDMGGRRVLVVGPIGTGVAPERAQQYRDSARKAADSRKCAYLATDKILRKDDFRESSSTPLTDIPVAAAQVKLGHEISGELKGSPVIPDEAAD